MDRDLCKFPAGAILISPSILAARFGYLAEDVRKVEAAGVELLHLDVMDGHLVPNISFGAPVIAGLRPDSNLLFDTHLMIEEPLRYAESFARAGADHLTFHLESKDNPQAVIDAIRNLGLTVGMSIKPATPAAALEPWLDQLDLVLVMTVEPGFGGQSFMPEMMPKLRELAAMRTARNLRSRLEVDGGITAETAPVALAAGADTLVAGSSVFRNPAGTAAAVAALRGN